jgi:hypothetical protein
MRTLALLVALVGCAVDSVEPGPDASVQAVEGLDAAAPADACTREATGDCCALLPDDAAARECAAATTAPGACGVLVCWSADCVQTKINFCAPG